MVKVCAFSDTHQNNEAAKRILERKDADIFLIAGDIELFKGSDKPIYYVFGNHDKDMFPKLLENLRWGHVQLDNFNYLNNGATYDYKGMKIVGINGNYAPTDYDKKRKNLKNQRHFTKEEIEHTKNIPFNIYFLLSHETPLGYADKKGNKNLGVEPITDLMKTLEPKFHICGHTHIQQMDKYKETYIINCGYGVNGEFVIIDLDNNKVEFYKEFELSDIKKID